MEVTLPKNWNKSFGTQLMALSVFIDTGVKKINVPANGMQKLFSTHKNVFGFTDDDLTIVEYGEAQPNINVVSPQDLFKMYNPYFIPPNLKPREVGSKKYIGLACYQDTNDFFNLGEPRLDFPRYKQYSIEEYAMLFQYIKSRGYEVLTLDSKEISVEEKIKLLTENCECVIGYEGGIGHLCHILQIPVILLPGYIDRYIFNMLMHLDKRTYFLKSLNELFEWNSIELANHIIDLHLGKGNNQFLNGLLSGTRFKDKYNNENLDVSYNLNPNLPTKTNLVEGIENTLFSIHNSSEAEYINKYCTNPVLGGIK